MRNCELLDDASLKTKGVDTVLLSWSSIMMYGVRQFEAITGGEIAARDEFPAFADWDAEAQAGFERLLKSQMPMLLSYVMYDCIGTRLLGKVFEDTLNAADKNSLRKFILVSTLLFMSVFDGYTGKERVWWAAKRFVRSTGLSHAHLTMFSEILGMIKSFPDASAADLDEADGLLAEIILALGNIRPGKRYQYGVMQQKIIQNFRRERGLRFGR